MSASIHTWRIRTNGNYQSTALHLKNFQAGGGGGTFKHQFDTFALRSKHGITPGLRSGVKTTITFRITQEKIPEMLWPVTKPEIISGTIPRIFFKN